MDMVELGRKIAEFSGARRVSFDGECYHLRLPLKIMKILHKYSAKTANAYLTGLWQSEKKVHVILTFECEEDGECNVVNQQQTVGN